MQAPPATPQGADKAEPRWKQAPPVTTQAPPKPRANLSEVDAIIEEAAAAIPGGYEAWAAKPADPQRMAALGYTPDPLAKSGYSRPRAPQAPIVDSGHTTNLFTDAMRMLEAPIAGLTGGASGGGLEGWAKTTTQNPLLGAKEAVDFLNPLDEAGRAYLGLRDAGAGLIDGDMGKAAQGAQQFVTEGSAAAIQAIPGTTTFKGLTGPVRRTPTTLAEAQRGASLYSVPGKPPLPAEPSIRQTGKTLAAVAVPGRPIRPQAMQAIERILLASGVPRDRVRDGLAKVVKGLQAGADSPATVSGRAPSISLLLKREFRDDFPEVATNLDLVRLERRLSRKRGDASPTIIREAVKDIRGSQASFLIESATRNAGATTRNETRENMEAALSEFGEEGYKPILSQPIDDKRAQAIRNVLSGPGMGELGKPLRQIAAGQGKTIEEMIAESPLNAAHWMQHKARLLKEENAAKGNTTLANAYDDMRNRILSKIDDLQTPDGKTYRQLRIEYADTAQIGSALRSADQFGAIVKDPEKANNFVKAFNASTPAQQEARLASIGDWMLSKLRGGGEDAPARMAELQSAGVLETLDRLGQKGKALADDIRAIRDEEMDLQTFFPKSESQSISNAVALAEGPQVYSRPGASSLPVNALADAALMGAGVASAPIMTAMRQGPRLYRGIMQPRTATREDMTRVLVARPRGPTRPQATQQALPAGPANALNPPSPVPAGPPVNPLTPRRPEQAGISANVTGLGGAGGAVAGTALAPDTNGDGVVDAQERMAGGMGGLVTGLGVGAGANRLLGPRRGAAPKAGPQKPPAQSGFGGGAAAPDVAAHVAMAKEQGFNTDKVYYHGAAKQFEQFDMSKVGQREIPWYGKGAYLSPDKEVARRYATSDQNVMPFFVRGKLLKVDKDSPPPEWLKNSRDWSATLTERGYSGLEIGGKIPELVVFNPSDLIRATPPKAVSPDAVRYTAKPAPWDKTGKSWVVMDAETGTDTGGVMSKAFAEDLVRSLQKPKR
jgi:hypothetical protein